MATRRAPSIRLAAGSATVGCAGGLVAVTAFAAGRTTGLTALLIGAVELFLLAVGLTIRSAAALTVAIAWLAATYAAAAAGDGVALETAGYAVGIVLLAELAFLAIADADALARRAVVTARLLSLAKVLAASVTVVAAVWAAAQLRPPGSVWLEPLGVAAAIVGTLALLRAFRPLPAANSEARDPPSCSS